MESMCLRITYSFLHPFMRIDHRSAFMRKAKLDLREIKRAIQIDLVPSRLRQLTVATGFAISCVTRFTGTSKRTYGIRASS